MNFKIGFFSALKFMRILLSQSNRCWFHNHLVVSSLGFVFGLLAFLLACLLALFPSPPQISSETETYVFMPLRHVFYSTLHNFQILKSQREKVFWIPEVHQRKALSM